MPYHTMTIEREQLYEQAWSEPIHKLCKQYSLSDRELGKLYARHGIPVPVLPDMSAGPNVARTFIAPRADPIGWATRSL